MKKLFEGLLPLLTPWYVFMGVLGAILIRDSILAFGGYDTLLKPGAHALLALVALFIAHSFRALKNEYKISNQAYRELAENSVKELNDVIAKQEGPTSDCAGGCCGQAVHPESEED